MIGTLDLYYIPNHQFANRQFYIGSKAAYLLGSVSGVKYNGNLTQTLKLPDNAHFAKFNLVGLGGKFYDVISVDSSTQEAKSSTLRITFNPVVSFLSPGLSITGDWDRTPTAQIVGGKVQIGNDMLKTTRTIALPRLTGNPARRDFYYQITAKYDVVTSDNSKLCLYGGIVPWASWMNADAALNTNETSPGSGRYWTPLVYVINDIDTRCGLPSSSIVDVSISARCPWYAQYTATNIFGFKDGSTYKNGYEVPRYLLNILQILGSGVDDTPDKTTALTITLTDYERYCGRVLVCDEMDNIVHEIPTELFNSSNQLTYYCYGASDYGGLYTHFKYLDKIVVWPEGHLPWIGDSWADYQTQTLTYDRAELARSIDAVNKQQDIDAIAAVSNAMLTGAVGAASGNPAGAVLGAAQMGAGLATAEMSAALNKEQLYAKQHNKENYIKVQPSANYQTGYGLDYCHRSEMLGGAKIKIQTPANLTSTDFSNYVAYHGYPCSKYATFNLAQGYIRGLLYSVPLTGDNPAGNGTEIDALRREIANGVRIVTA